MAIGRSDGRLLRLGVGERAIDRMIDNARLLGGNAVIAMRFDSSEIGKARAEVVAYGTAMVAAPSA